MDEMNLWFMVGGLGLFLLMAAARSFTRPLKWIWYGFVYAAIGAVVLFVINLLGQYVNLHIPINPVTALIAGLLGAPGVLYLACVQWIWIGG
jgi:inhibitor of the pro-sigma K processing machinery